MFCYSGKHTFALHGKEQGDERMRHTGREWKVDLKVVPNLGDDGIMMRFPEREN